jgi:Zn-dependent protease with chaperone function
MKVLKKVSVSLFLLTLIALPLLASAQEPTVEELKTGELFGGAQVSLGQKPLTETIASVINVALGLLGVVAVVIILIGGFMWMTAGGNEEKVGKAKKLLMAGVIGLAIILSAYAIARFVVSSLMTATAG